MHTVQAVPAQDASAQYLAGLPTTDAVLSALRRAHTARLALLQGSAATTEQSAQLGSRSGEGCMPPVCGAGLFSACGQFLAVSYLRYDQGPSGVGIFQLSGGMLQQQACFQSNGHAPVFCWDPEVPLLGIAQPGDLLPEGSSVAQQPAVLVYDAGSKSILHALGQQNEGIFRSLCQSECRFWAKWPKLAWSASGDLLMVSTLLNESHSWKTLGLLAIFSVREDRLVALSQFSMEVFSDQMLAAMWHPSSRGLVLSYRVKLKDPKAFSDAGLAVTTLPEVCFLSTDPALGFSPDKRKLLAHQVVTEGYDSFSQHMEPIPAGSFNEEEPIMDRACNNFLCSCVLRCTSVGPGASIEVEQDLVADYSYSWMPCSTGLIEEDLMNNRALAANLPYLDTGYTILDCAAQRGGRRGVSPRCFSPSQLFMADLEEVPRIMDLNSGRVLWAAEPRTAWQAWSRGCRSGPSTSTRSSPPSKTASTQRCEPEPPCLSAQGLFVGCVHFT